MIDLQNEINNCNKCGDLHKQTKIFLQKGIGTQNRDRADNNGGIFDGFGNCNPVSSGRSIVCHH